MSGTGRAAQNRVAEQRGDGVLTDSLSEALILTWLAALFIVCAIGVYNAVDALP